MKLNSLNKPKQSIPESKKDETWVKNNIDWCIGVANFRAENYDQLYQIFNGERDQAQFEHITKTYGVEFPAGKLKHYPLVKPMLNTLASEQEERPFNWTVYSNDTDSLATRESSISNQLLASVFNAIRSEEELNIALDKLERFYNEEFQMPLEKGVNEALKAYLQNNKVHETFNDQFLDKLISAKEFYRCYVERVGQDPVYKRIVPGQLAYASNNVKWVRNCDWAVHVEALTVPEIYDRYGEHLSDSDKRYIDHWEGSSWSDTILSNINTYEMLDELISDSGFLDNKLPVYHTEFKSIRKINFLKNPNKYDENAPHVKFINDEELQKINGKKKKNIQHRYIQDLYSGTRIGTEVYVKHGRNPFAIRSMRDPSKVSLTFNGMTHNGKVEAVSMVEMTQDLQDMYDIMHYHKMNMVSLAGTRGSLMDLSQMPDFGFGGTPEGRKENIKMWMYYKKLGLFLIDSSMEGAGNFNQFTQIDESLSPAIGNLINIITHLEETAGRIIGVNRQRMGAIAQRDGKANTEQAIIQSNLITERLFNDHDELVCQALEDIVNQAKVAWKDGYTTSYVSNDFIQKVVTLDPGWEIADYGVFITNRINEQASIDQIRQFAYREYDKGLMEFKDLLPLFRKTNLADLNSYISQSIERRRERIEEQQANAMQLQQQMEAAKGQAELQKLQSEIQKTNADIQFNQQKLVLEQEALRIEEEHKDSMVGLEKQRVALEQAQLTSENSKAKEIRND